ncbi:beta-glucosidase BglX [Coprobacter tertius]|uniref:beta-glucosidase BglX n=1 Tax=Coprobacter tertius TaxID=2944915 RepID=UPI0020CBA0D4|nr:beta-glucosidase BglX [Coprobacter tertius]
MVIKNRIIIVKSFFIISVILFAFDVFAYDFIGKKEVELERKIDELISRMTLSEKIGQLNQLNGNGLSDNLKSQIRNGSVGTMLNEVNPEISNELQRIAVEESRLGIPLIFARDVIHGFKTVFPIPLAQAASWDEEIVKKGARIAAEEATSRGIRWTFAPMLDISRDARWGRIIESLGEDPYLASRLGVAMVEGFQGKSLSSPNGMAACLKHFCGYGAVEGGRDYNTTQISEEQLRNIYFVPFKSCINAGAATLMAAFNDLNGVPCTANRYLLNTVLRSDWNFDGVVVSDWNSVHELINHGYARDGKQAAELAVNAGVDIDMMSLDYISSLEGSVKEKVVKESVIDNAVRNILRLKFRLGLFHNPYVEIKNDVFYTPEYLEAAKESAIKSCVLLKNTDKALPLSEKIKSIAVIGPMADAPADQLGAWTMDGERQHTITPLQDLKKRYGNTIVINYVKGLDYSRDLDRKNFEAAVAAVEKSDVVLFFAGEEAGLTGEARCRADISLPGAQKDLLSEIAAAGKPIILIMLAGRPIEIYKELPLVKAFLYAWHPGTMGGPAIIDLLFGKAVPSGRLPISYPMVSAQLPYYYNHKNTGRPAVGDLVMMENMQQNEIQTSFGHTCYYLDAGRDPLYPFGYGLSYTTFRYGELNLSANDMTEQSKLTVSVPVTNTGNIMATETVQLYIRDVIASVTRPVKELKAYRKVCLKPGEEKNIVFEISIDDLKFYTANGEYRAEPGEFIVYVGANSRDVKEVSFTLK